MLQIRVHHRDERGGRGHHPFDAGGGEPATAETLQATHAAVDASQRADRLRRAVGGVVVDEDHFPAVRPERARQAFAQLAHVGGFVERGDDHRQTQTADGLEHVRVGDRVRDSRLRRCDVGVAWFTG